MRVRLRYIVVLAVLAGCGSSSRPFVLGGNPSGTGSTSTFGPPAGATGVVTPTANVTPTTH